MCLALFHAKGHRLTEEEFDNAAMANSDGVGFAYYSKKNNIMIEKGTNIFEMKEKYFSIVEKVGERSPFMVHFRLATHGSVSDTNCHPFRINQHDVMIHNGVLPVVYGKGEHRTDTQVFADEYLAKLPDCWYDNDYLYDMVEDYCSGSKLVIMTNNPKSKYGIYVINSKQGSYDQENNRWFSNSSHQGSWMNYRNWSKPSAQAKSVTSNDIIAANACSWDDDSYLLEKCDMCGRMEVVEEVCYECGTCQRCYNDTMSDCKCWDESNIHGMTQEQFSIEFGGL
jgi:glutamine amidotransferase